MNKESYLAVMPHPDDESIYTGGTLNRLTNVNNGEVHLLTLTDGANGRNSGTSEAPLVQIRKRELAKASHIIGLTTVHIGNQTDGSIGASGAIEEIISAIKQYNPHTILTLDEGGLTNPDRTDHSNTSIATFLAIAMLGLTGELDKLDLQKYHTATLPEKFLKGTHESWATIADEALPVKPVALTSAEIRTKLDASMVYDSQRHLVGDGGFFRRNGLLSTPVERWQERIWIVGNGDERRIYCPLFPGTDPNAYASSAPDFYDSLRTRVVQGVDGAGITPHEIHRLFTSPAHH